MSCSARRGSTELELAVKKLDFKNKKLNALARTCTSEFTRSCVGGWLITRMCTITRAHTHTRATAQSWIYCLVLGGNHTSNVL